MAEPPFDAEHLASVPTGGLVPLYTDADGVMHWSASLSGATVPDHDHKGVTGDGGPSSISFIGRNTTGSSIPAGTAVRFEATSSGTPTISLARANLVGDMPCVGITVAAIANGATGTVRQWGLISNIDTSAFSSGDPLYVDGAVAGGLVVSANPPADIAQRVGAVITSHATTGSIFVYIDPQMDGHVQYTNRDEFEVHSPTTATASLNLTGTGGGAFLQATPTGSRILTLPDATDTLVGKATTDFLTGKTFDELRVLSTGAAFDLYIASNEVLTADRRLRISVGDTDRTLTIGASASVSGSNTGDQTITLTGDVTGSGTGSFAATIANDAVTMAKLANGTIGHTLKGGTTDPGFVAAGILFRREWQYLADPTLATGTVVGLRTAPTLSGTVSSQDSNVRPLVRHVTGTTSGNSAGVLSGFDITRSGWLPRMSMVVQTGASLSSGRWWFGFTTADLTGVATPTTQHVAAFSYDTGRDGTVFWRTVTNDGVGAATVTAAATAIATATTYNLRIELNGATNVLFYIDDVLVATHTTTLPSISSILGFQMSATTLTTGAGTAKRFEWSRVGGEMI